MSGSATKATIMNMTWPRRYPCNPFLLHSNYFQVADDMINRDDESFPVVVIQEKEEPEEFWQAMGGKKKYLEDGSFFKHTRLFRCTNEKGYFAVSEKTVDFCQDDLDNDDVMILDNGNDVILWIGERSSEIEGKLGYKAGTVGSSLQMRVTTPFRSMLLI